MKKILLSFLAVTVLTFTSRADEGMWLLPTIVKLNLQQMQAEGLRLSAADIYSVNKASLKDAVVNFSGGCTAEVVSDQGLLLTNHHCGYGAIQQHSTVEHDYLADGFWAMSLEQEIPTPGLWVAFVKEIIDVTDEIIPKIKGDNLTEAERDKQVAEIAKKVIEKKEKKIKKNIPGATLRIEKFFGGNQYVLFVYQRFEDVRLVGAPPSSIGKFGGDTDNWMWPRHTGDFSVFRVYSAPDGSPAEYAAENKPLKPVKFLPISIKGVRENDFSMIIGFPGSTDRYMTSWEMKQRTDIGNTIRIHVRGIRQEILLSDMMADPKVKIQYANKYASSSNYWKNSIGMNEALRKLGVADKKRALEGEFAGWVYNSTERRKEYGEALPMIERAVADMSEDEYVLMYISETVFRASEMLAFALNYDRYKELPESVSNFFKNYNPDTDRKVTTAMMKIVAEKLPAEDRPAYFNEMLAAYGTVEKMVAAIFKTEIFGSEEQFKTYIASGDTEKYKDDDAYKLGTAFLNKWESIQDSSNYKSAVDNLTKGRRLWMKGLVEMNKGEKTYYPDAHNLTMRLTYGTVKPYSPRDGVLYKYYTTLDGVMEKEDLANPQEFTVPEKLKELWKAKDYGIYANDKGELVTGFIADLDITGGNSGSPVLNADGELVGLAFDGNWEALSGDIIFEEELQRCINVDIRYVLFIIDKYADCQRLLAEMEIRK